MVDAFICSKRSCFVQLPSTAGHGDDARIEEFGNLNSSAADSAAGAPDQHRLPKPQPAVGDQHVPCGEKHEWDGSRLFEGKTRRLWENVRFGTTAKPPKVPFPWFSGITVSAPQMVWAEPAL